MHRLGRQAHEVEDPVRLLAEGHRVRLEGVDDVRELDRVADEEDRQVVADQVPVAVLGLELDGEAARVAGDLGRIAAADDGREADDDRRALALGLEQLGARVGRGRLVADRAVRLEHAVRHEAARVDDALGDPLAVEVADLLEEVVVLERRRPATAHRPLVLVVDDGMALPRRQARTMTAFDADPARAILAADVVYRWHEHAFETEIRARSKQTSDLEGVRSRGRARGRSRRGAVLPARVARADPATAGLSTPNDARRARPGLDCGPWRIDGSRPGPSGSANRSSAR